MSPASTPAIPFVQPGLGEAHARRLREMMLVQQERLIVARSAPRRTRTALPFGVWMALGKATPIRTGGEDAQALLAPPDASATAGDAPTCPAPVS